MINGRDTQPEGRCNMRYPYKMQYLPIAKRAIPYSVDIKIEGITFEFTFNYNSDGDFFTVDLARNGEQLVNGEKIVYGRPLFMTYFTEQFPLKMILPMDGSLEESRVGWEELQETVYLYMPGVAEDA